MYHNLLQLINPQPTQQLNQLHTGWYEFYFQGGIVTGNVRRIGEHTLSVDIPLAGGLKEIPVLTFLDSQISKL